MIALIFLTTLFVIFGISLLIGYGIDPNGFHEGVKNFFDCFRKYDIQDQMSFFQEATWVIKVIKSCETWKQFYNSKKLISFLHNKYENKVKSEIVEEIMNKLWSVSNVKRYEID